MVQAKVGGSTSFPPLHDHLILLMILEFDESVKGPERDAAIRLARHKPCLEAQWGMRFPSCLGWCVGAIAVSALQITPITQENGIASLVGIPGRCGSSSVAFAGTKRGTLLRYEWKEGERPRCTWRHDGLDSKCFPIYSLAVSNTRDSDYLTVFGGGGDRYISLVTIDSQTDETVVDEQQRLGPHTGWVKDLLFDAEKNRLYSIGCNCIETWAPLWKGGGAEWRHKHKYSVESSVEDGSTLSSDLLCLCHHPGGCILVGGVDGRIHVVGGSAEPPFSFGAHDGRVTALLYHDPHALLVSCSHDGSLQCRFAPHLSTDCQAAAATASQQVTDTHGNNLRLTACAITNTTDDAVSLVVGSSSGVIVQIRVSMGANPHSISSLTEEWRLTLPTNSMINAILPSSWNGKTSSILVGHAQGLDLLSGMGCIN